MRPFITKLANTDPIRAFSSIQHRPYSLLLDSADIKHQSSRYSFVMCDPCEIVEIKNGNITITNDKETLTLKGDPFAVLQERIKRLNANMETIPDLPPFQGGAAGLFSYDLGRTIENLPNIALDNENLPDMAVGIYDQVLAYDHLKQQAWIITHANNEQEAENKRQPILEAIKNTPEDKAFKPSELPWESNFDAFEYTQNVQKIIEYIKAGDIFQASLSQRFDAQLPTDFDAFRHYKHMRNINPAPFAAFMNLGSIKISSASPERFLSVENNTVETHPIKGTRPHIGNEILDKAIQLELKNSEKDKAENIMIVDLLRNDLSKVCEPHSIEVTDLCKLESFTSVHHLVSVIKGQLRHDKSPLDLLRACFPGGSITGAPKIRAMEIIEEIEPTRRGAYCGSIGYIGFNGQMDSSILIRTLVYQGNTVSLQSGGGIVADSDPDKEYQETFDKANALFSSFEDFTYEIEENYLKMMAGVK
ncbi:MAG: aminodeoxychorismate synthase component I [Alphaproteobacteria bacterium]|nr:aminodeoxychorismate synthase component I [Alphaproteobacteria bacterium]